MGYNPTMPYFRIFSTLAVGLLVPLVTLGQAPPEPPTLAENVLTKTVIELRLRTRIAAEIVQDVDMLSQKFRLEGNYYRDTGHRIRLQLNLKDVGDSGSTMLQVCDGKILWDYKKVLGMESYNRRDISLILKRLQDPALDDPFRNLVSTNLGFGGPEAMLSGLQLAVKFDQFAEEKLDGVDSYVLGGSWRDRSKLMGPNDRPLGPTAPLPPYVPSNVRVFIDKANFWPYRVVMIGAVPSEMFQADVRQIDAASGRPIGIKKAPPKVDPTQITLNYKLLPVSEIRSGLFAFNAPANAANLKDDTDEFLGQLDGFIQQESSRKKAEAAKAEGEPLLKAPALEVPSPGPDPALPAPSLELPSPK